jgi:hypothetical protein
MDHRIAELVVLSNVAHRTNDVDKDNDVTNKMLYAKEACIVYNLLSIPSVYCLV